MLVYQRVAGIAVCCQHQCGENPWGKSMGTNPWKNQKKQLQPQHDTNEVRIKQQFRLPIWTYASVAEASSYTHRKHWCIQCDQCECAMSTLQAPGQREINHQVHHLWTEPQAILLDASPSCIPLVHISTPLMIHKSSHESEIF